MASADQILSTLQRARSGLPADSNGAQDLDRQIANRQAAMTIPETLAAPFSKPKATTSARAVLSAPPSPADSRGAPGYQTDLQRGGNVSPAASALASVPPSEPEAAPPAVGEVTRVGNSYSGTNVAGDITVNGKAPGGGFMVADGQSRALPVAAGTASGGSVAGVQAPVVRHSGNDWQARNDLRNAQVSASSIMNNGGPWDRHGKGVVSPERAAYQAMLGTDQALRMAQPGADTAALQADAGLQREVLHQQGANARAVLNGGIDQQRVELQRVAQGYSNRAAAQQEQLRAQIAAEVDPNKRKALVQRMLDIEGKAQTADPYLVVPGGQHVDPQSGRAYNTPSSVFNRQSGQFVQQQGQGGGSAPHSDGQRLQGKDGRFYVVKNGVPVPE